MLWIEWCRIHRKKVYIKLTQHTGFTSARPTVISFYYNKRFGCWFFFFCSYRSNTNIYWKLKKSTATVIYGREREHSWSFFDEQMFACKESIRFFFARLPCIKPNTMWTCGNISSSHIINTKPFHSIQKKGSMLRRFFCSSSFAFLPIRMRYLPHRMCISPSV